MSIDPDIRMQESNTPAAQETPVRAGDSVPADVSSVQEENSVTADVSPEPEQAPAGADDSPRAETPSAPKINLVAVGFRSAFWTVVAGILLWACILTFSPYTAMRFYTKLDMKDMALYSAEKYLRWYSDECDIENGVYPKPNGKYVDALYCAVNNADYLMNKNTGTGKYSSKKAQYYAKRVDKYASEYISLNGIVASLLSDRTAKIDTYALQHTSAALHPYVYSYIDRLSVERFKAWYILGEKDKMFDSVNEATSYWAQENWQVKESDFLVLGQLSAYIDAELNNLGLRELIESKTEGMLMWDDVPKSALLYGEDKPFDLLVYDRLDVDPYGNLYVEQGQFTQIYDRVSQTALEGGGEDVRNNYREFVAFLRSNMRTYAANGPTPNRAEHLKYTYYLKTLTDFWRSMYNMSMLLDGQSAYFPHADELNSARTLWTENSGIPNVYYYPDGYEQGGKLPASGVGIYDWYKLGALTDYLGFFKQQ